MSHVGAQTPTHAAATQQLTLLTHLFCVLSFLLRVFRGLAQVRREFQAIHAATVVANQQNGVTWIERHVSQLAFPYNLLITQRLMLVLA